MVARDDDDPRAPYKVYEGDELKGTYATRYADALRTAKPSRSGASAPRRGSGRASWIMTAG
jgi:hypothetical protein